MLVFTRLLFIFIPTPTPCPTHELLILLENPLFDGYRSVSKGMEGIIAFSCLFFVTFFEEECAMSYFANHKSAVLFSASCPSKEQSL